MSGDKNGTENRTVFEEVLGFLLTHPFQDVQVGVLSSPALPIPNIQMELHRDSNQPM